MDIAQATAWASDRSLAVLITIRADGRPQSSDIVYDLDGGTFVISVIEGRAKTANLRRDPRAVLHVSDASSWSYVSFDGAVELSPTASSPGDATCDALVRYYERVTGKPHPDLGGGGGTAGPWSTSAASSSASPRGQLPA